MHGMRILLTAIAALAIRVSFVVSAGAEEVAK